MFAPWRGDFFRPAHGWFNRNLRQAINPILDAADIHGSIEWQTLKGGLDRAHGKQTISAVGRLRPKENRAGFGAEQMMSPSTRRFIERGKHVEIAAPHHPKPLRIVEPHRSVAAALNPGRGDRSGIAK